MRCLDVLTVPLSSICVAVLLAAVSVGSRADRALAATAAESASVQKPMGVPDAAPAVVAPAAKTVTGAAAPTAAYSLDWYSVNAGGTINAASANYRLGLTVGQSAAGAAQGRNYNLGIGFWYGVTGGAVPCAVLLTGDVNLTGTLTSGDIIYLVNFVFKSGPAPQPCTAAGDVGCNGSVTSADIIYLVNSVFKSGPAPCDVCTVIPSLWSCP